NLNSRGGVWLMIPMCLILDVTANLLSIAARFQVFEKPLGRKPVEQALVEESLDSQLALRFAALARDDFQHLAQAVAPDPRRIGKHLVVFLVDFFGVSAAHAHSLLHVADDRLAQGGFGLQAIDGLAQRLEKASG